MLRCALLAFCFPSCVPLLFHKLRAACGARSTKSSCTLRFRIPRAGKRSLQVSFWKLCASGGAASDASPRQQQNKSTPCSQPPPLAPRSPGLLCLVFSFNELADYDSHSSSFCKRSRELSDCCPNTLCWVQLCFRARPQKLRKFCRALSAPRARM